MNSNHSTPNPFAYVDASNLIKPDTRTAAERWLDKELERRGANEQGAEAGVILRQIALELLERQMPMGRVAERKLDSLITQGYRVCGVMIERPNPDATNVQRGAVSAGGMVIWWNPDTATPTPKGRP